MTPLLKPLLGAVFLVAASAFLPHAGTPWLAVQGLGRPRRGRNTGPCGDGSALSAVRYHVTLGLSMAFVSFNLAFVTWTDTQPSITTEDAVRNALWVGLAGGLLTVVAQGYMAILLLVMAAAWYGGGDSVDIITHWSVAVGATVVVAALLVCVAAKAAQKIIIWVMYPCAVGFTASLSAFEFDHGMERYRNAPHDETQTPLIVAVGLAVLHIVLHAFLWPLAARRCCDREGYREVA